MKAVRATIVAGILAGAYTAANAWFFFYIPASVTGPMADRAAASGGELCVPDSTKVGDRLRVYAETFEVKAIVGSSPLCQQQAMPLRVKMGPITSQATPKQ